MKVIVFLALFVTLVSSADNSQRKPTGGLAGLLPNLLGGVLGGTLGVLTNVVKTVSGPLTNILKSQNLSGKNGLGVGVFQIVSTILNLVGTLVDIVVTVLGSLLENVGIGSLLNNLLGTAGIIDGLVSALTPFLPILTALGGK